MWPRGWVKVCLYSSITAAVEVGEWSAARPGRSLPPGKTMYPFYRRLVGSQGRSGRAENLVPTGIPSQTDKPVVSRYTNWAAEPTHQLIKNVLIQLSSMNNQYTHQLPTAETRCYKRPTNFLYDNIHRSNITSLRANKTTTAMNSSQTQLNRDCLLISGTHTTFHDIISCNFNILCKITFNFHCVIF